MAEPKKISTRIINKHATAAVWNNTNFTPLQGEIVVYDPGYDSTDGKTYSYERMKIGDGSHTIQELPFITENFNLELTAEDNNSLLMWDNNNSTFVSSPLEKGTGNNSLVINEGVASGNTSIAGGTTDKTILDGLLGGLTGTAAALALKASEAKGAMSISLGANNRANTGGSVALGYDNISGGKGYYVTAIDTTNKTITLSTKQTSTTSPGNPSWNKGDKLFFVNDNRYWLEVAEKTSSNVVTVVEMPFTSLVSVNSLTSKPNERSIININKPESGTVDIGWGAIGIGTQNTVVGSNAYAVGYKNIVAGDFGVAFGNENIVGYCASATGANNQALGRDSVATGDTTLASGSCSSAEGYKTQATEYTAHAEGNATKATNVATHAEGYQTQATGRQAHAEGNNTSAQGEDSHAEGNNTIASGSYSHAEGHYTTASGEDSHAEGNSTRAGGQKSHAEGKFTTAEGEGSHAEGDQTLASGNGAHAEGGYINESRSDATHVRTTAEGYGSHAEGGKTYAKAQFAHAEGIGTEALGSNSHAEGRLTRASNYHAHAEGNWTTASGEASHSEGSETLAMGKGSHAEGVKTSEIRSDATHTCTQAEGIGSHAEGGSTYAKGNYSHAEGVGSEALKPNSHAEGRKTKADGYHSHAEGNCCEALGESSHAEGSETIAKAKASHAGGIGTIAKGEAQTVIGKYNKEDEYALFIIGAGDNNDNRETVLSVNKFETRFGRRTDNNFEGVIIEHGLEDGWGYIRIGTDENNVQIRPYGLYSSSAFFINDSIIVDNGIKLNDNITTDVVINGDKALKIGNTVLNEEKLAKIIKFIDSIEEVTE